MSESRDSIERIEAALARLGEEHEPPVGWEARVLAAAAPPRKRPWWVFAAGPALVAAIAIVMIALPRKPSRALEVAIDVRKSPIVVRGEPGDGELDPHDRTAHLGDTVVIRASAGAKLVALWIYHDEHELVLQCPGQPGCKAITDGVAADLPIARIGGYQIVVVAAETALAAPTGNYDADVARAENVNAVVSQYKVTVR
jgi:hypothetical protein